MLQRLFHFSGAIFAATCVASRANPSYHPFMGFDRKQSPSYMVSQLAKEFARALQARASGLGFSAGQFPILVELWEEDGLTQKQLLERVDVEQATMANTLSRMQRDGLIERKPHPTDRRAQLVFLTPKGLEIKDGAIAAVRATDDALLAGLKRFEKELLLEFIRRALANVDDSGRSDPQP
jgi:DNA-binding MarR family transcriptional regulator